MSVTPAVIAVTLGRPTPATSSRRYAQWAMWIEDARRIIENRLGDLAALDQGDLDFVVREAVAERARHPNGTVSETVSVDDGTMTKRFRNDTSSQIEILDEWWDMLTPGVQDQDAFTIRPYELPPRCS